MKNYSIESNLRLTSNAAIAAIAVALTLMTYQPAVELSNYITTIFPNMMILNQMGVIGTIEPMALYGFGWYLFDNHIWKWRILRRWHCIPDLDGKWDGEFKSSFVKDDGAQASGSAIMDIDQTFSKMSIQCKFGESSESSAITIGLSEFNRCGNKCSLQFSYRNRATDDSVSFNPDRESLHEGFNVIIFDSDSATGDYVTFRGTCGKLLFKRR